MERPVDDIAGCRSSHERLDVAIGTLSEHQMRRASLLPGWSIGHVLTHLARNAEAMVRRIDAALDGREIEQYADGADGRAAEIDAGANRPADVLCTDVRTWSRRLDDAFETLPEDEWGRQVKTVAGTTHAIDRLPFRRWREVEVHLVDLDVGITPSDWPTEFVDRALPNLLGGLRDRAEDRALTAWILGRGDAPTLDSWG